MNLTEYITKNHKHAISKPFGNYNNLPMDHDLAIVDLFDVCYMLDTNNVTYRLLFGTMLGLYRDNKLIPHDADMDIVVRYSDQQKLCECVQKLEKNGFKICRYTRDVLLTVFRNNVYIDIYLFKNAGSKFKCAVYELNENDFKETSELEIDGYVFYTIPDPESFFKKYYGGDWKTPIKGLSAHPKHTNRK